MSTATPATANASAKTKQHVKKKLEKQRKAKEKQQREAEITTVPRSIVLYRGKKSSHSMKTLVQDFRTIMMPYTAKNLKSGKTNKLKTVIDFASEIYVTHLIIFNSGIESTKMKIARLPHGPTLEFSINEYSTAQDIRDFQTFMKERVVQMGKIREPPMVVLNNFNTDETQVKLMAVTFQNMFPPVDVQKFKVKDAKRVVLFNYDPETEQVEMRHYFVKRPEASGSEADAAEDEEKEGAPKTRKTQHIRLSDMGPHIKFSLYRVLEGVFTGETIYHSQFTKTPDEIEKQRQQFAQKKALAKQRREQQEANVERKKSERDAKVANKRQKLYETFKDAVSKENTDREGEVDDQSDDEEDTGAKYTPFASRGGASRGRGGDRGGRGGARGGGRGGRGGARGGRGGSSFGGRGGRGGG
ncbi:hypothetical protein AKO1_014728, partial [Acrasis kona]